MIGALPDEPDVRLFSSEEVAADRFATELPHRWEEVTARLIAETADRGDHHGVPHPVIFSAISVVRHAVDVSWGVIGGSRTLDDVRAGRVAPFCEHCVEGKGA